VLATQNPCDNNSNPCSSPWTDYTTPVQMSWTPAQSQNWPHPAVNPAIPAPTVSGTSATFTFNTFKPATTTIYLGTANPGSCNLGNPAPPFCMATYPNFGFQGMMQASYANHSSPVAAVKNNNTTNQYDPIGAPNVYNTTVTVTGLAPNTTYHWRPLVVDNNGNTAAYYDQTFTTTDSPGGLGGGHAARLESSTRPESR
jgi:hypothetical protein